MMLSLFFAVILFSCTRAQLLTNTTCLCLTSSLNSASCTQGSKRGLGSEHGVLFETRLMPRMMFICNGTLTALTMGGRISQIGTMYPKLQIWRGGPNTFIKYAEILIDVEGSACENMTEVSRCDDMFHCILSPSYQVNVHAGDIMGVELPLLDNQGFELHFRSSSQRQYVWRRQVNSSRLSINTADVRVVDDLLLSVNVKGRVCVHVSITEYGTNTAGETYSLECSATVTGSTDQPTITWLDPMDNPVPSEMVTTTSSTSILTFSPLTASNAGTYTCKVLVTAGNVTETQTSTVIVNVITAQVTRSSSGPLTAGQTGFSLSCDVTGTENLGTPTFTYQWRSGGVITGEQGSTLSLSPLVASNAGEYNCSVTVSSTSLSSTVTVNSNNSETVMIKVPPPSLVTVTNGSVKVGSDVILTCTVELSPAVDVSVTVNTEWTGPAGFMTTNTAQPVKESTTTYTSTTIVRPFGRDQSGNYTCTATVRPQSTSTYLAGSGALSNTVAVIATIAPPLNIQATQSSASAPVEVSWSPPSTGPTSITGYRIFHGNGENVSVTSIVTRVILAMDEDSVGQTVSVRSEDDQLASQLNTVIITTPPHVKATPKLGCNSSQSCAVEIGVTVGVMLLIVSVGFVITVVIVYMLRKRIAGKSDLDQSTNMPTPLYENPDNLTSGGQGNYELVLCPVYETTTTKPHPPSNEVNQSSHYEL